MRQSEIEVALLLARAAEETALLSEASDDLQMTLSELLAEVSAALGPNGILALQEVDRLSQTLKGLARLMRALSEIELEKSLSENEVRLSTGLDSLADRLLSIVAAPDDPEDFLFFSGNG